MRIGRPIYGWGVDETVLSAGALRQQTWEAIGAVAKVAGWMGTDPARRYPLDAAAPPPDSGLTAAEHRLLQALFPGQTSISIFHVNAKMSVLQMHDSAVKTDIDTLYLGGVRQTQSSTKSNADRALKRG